MFITPNWSAPYNIRALCTTRNASLSNQSSDELGFSLPPYNAFNLATHVGDNAAHIQKNRHLLYEQACLPNVPFWLDQQHTTKTVCLDSMTASTWQAPVADASWTTQANLVSVVMTADCIPMLVTNKSGTLVSAIHAGWKGLAEGIVSQSLQALPDTPNNLLVWIGPCIRQPNFEVGEDVYTEFTATNPKTRRFFKSIASEPEQKYLADLAGLLNLELKQFGVNEIYDSGMCSYAQSEQFYSYRREGVTGRMASLIWIEAENR